MKNDYLVIWKSHDGQQVSTLVDEMGEFVWRDDSYVSDEHIPVIDDPDDLLNRLDRADGVRYAVRAEVARESLGWDV